ncbi:MAG: hypothetical protein R3C31_05385 [Hyphomonadaceae bacterium]
MAESASATKTRLLARGVADADRRHLGVCWITSNAANYLTGVQVMVVSTVSIACSTWASSPDIERISS